MAAALCRRWGCAIHSTVEGRCPPLSPHHPCCSRALPSQIGHLCPLLGGVPTANPTGQVPVCHCFPPMRPPIMLPLPCGGEINRQPGEINRQPRGGGGRSPLLTTHRRMPRPPNMPPSPGSGHVPTANPAGRPPLPCRWGAPAPHLSPPHAAAAAPHHTAPPPPPAAHGRRRRLALHLFTLWVTHGLVHTQDQAGGLGGAGDRVQLHQ